VSDGEPSVKTSRRPQSRHWYRAALLITIALVVFVVIMLPFAIRSMQEVLGRSRDPLFDLITGQPVDPVTAAAAEADATYLNFGFVSLDDDTGVVTLAVSGNRNCGDACPALDLTLTSLEDDADQRRGLPPSASLKLNPDDTVFSQSVQLPVLGQPSLYPFDEYVLWLGVGGIATMPDGSTLELNTEASTSHAVITIQNRIPDMVMQGPVKLDPESVQSATDPFAFLAVQAMSFQRPTYLKVLAVVLVLLIAVSASMALFTRGLDELALGVGGLILGVWGVRSVLMPQSLSTVTAVDLALSWVILLLLLGLAVRAALHFHRRSEIPVPRVVRRKAGGGRREG
jgi:hypothetical protein